MKDFTNYCFYVGLTDYDRNELETVFLSLEKHWICYGAKSKKTLWALDWPMESFVDSSLAKQLPLDCIESAAFLMTKKFGSVNPHTDTRSASFLIPIMGDFQNSSLEFYDSYESKQVINVTDASDKFASTSVTYTVGDPSFSISYERPIIINSNLIHAVKNPTKYDRITVSLTFKSELSYRDVFEIFQISKQ